MTWHRHINDIFVVWDGPLELLRTFLDGLNTNVFNILFTLLDTLVRIDSLGNISTTLYRKPTVGNSILRANSAHPVALKRSVPIAQYLRIRLICSFLSDFKTQARALQDQLLQKGYSRTLFKKKHTNKP